MVKLTWKGSVEDQDMIAVYKALELYTITLGLDRQWAKNPCRKVIDKTWWMLKAYDIANTFYVAFYLNLIPFLVVIISSVMLLTDNISS